MQCALHYMYTVRLGLVSYQFLQLQPPLIFCPRYHTLDLTLAKPFLMYACTALFLCGVKNAVLPTHMCTLSVGSTMVANTGRHRLQNTFMIAKYD